MHILGISCFYHDAAACLIKDGSVVAASSEDRFSRKKHDPSFPNEAITFCLKQGKVSAKQLDYVVFYEKPLRRLQRIIFSSLATSPFSSRFFLKGMMNWFYEKSRISSVIANQLGIDSRKILFVPHHMAHAASAFYPSAFTKAALLTMEGVGEWSTTTFGTGDATKIHIIGEIRFPHSLGLLYSVFTTFLGFEVNDGEQHVMGMARFGKPDYIEKVRKLVRQFPDGSFQMQMKYFSYHQSVDSAFSNEFVKLFGKPRDREKHFFTKKTGFPKSFGIKPKDYEKLCEENQYYADIAASIQAFSEETILKLAKNIHEKTGLENLCIAGSVGLNTYANSRLLREGPFRHIFVQPAAGDDGAAMGAALYAYHVIRKKKRSFAMQHAYFGEGFSESNIVQFLKEKKVSFTQMESEELALFLAKKIANEKSVGFFQGRSEWGSQSLGNRSILADPRSEKMRDSINVKSKSGALYESFSSVVLADKIADYFDVDGFDHALLTNYALGMFGVKKEKRKKIPAVLSVDGKSQVQAISRKQNLRFYNLVKAFDDLTSIPMLLSAPLCLKDEPLANSPEDALKVFEKLELDYLVMENCVVKKGDL